MKVFNLSYNDKKRLAEVYAITGKPYGLIRSLGRGGTGSARGILLDAPGEIMKLFEGFSYQKYCNIQEMTNGIIIGFRSRLESFGVPMGFDEIARIEIKDLKEQESKVILEIENKKKEIITIEYSRFESTAIRKFITSLKNNFT
jgi:hypothetical protein